MRRIAALAAAALLSGCGLVTNAVRSNVLDYSDAIADTSDKFLLINVLEARDNAPLHFVEIPKINGSLQATATLSASIPFDTTKFDGGSASNLTDSASPGVTVQSSPSFEVDNLDTKEFAQGMTSAINPKQVEYWISKGLDQRILLLLFFSSVKITDLDCSALKDGDANDYANCMAHKGASIMVQNDPRRAADEFRKCMDQNRDFDKCHARTSFEHYLRMINDMKEGFTANTYGERALLASKVDIDPKDLASFDPSKYEVEYVTGDDSGAALGDVKGKLTATVTGAVTGELTGKLTGSVTSKKSSHYNIYSATEDGKIALCFRDQPIADSGVPDPAECTLPTVTDITMPSDETAVYVNKARFNDETAVYVNKARFNDTGDICADARLQADPKPFGILEMSHQSSPTSYCRIFLGYLSYLKALTQSNERADGKALKPAVDAGDAGYRLVVSIRSAAEIVRYIGDVLYYQDVVAEEHEKYASITDNHHNVPLTLGYSTSCHYPQTPDDQLLAASDPGCVRTDNGYLFRLNGDKPPRFGVDYKGVHYTVDAADSSDHTLEVLGILSLSIALNRSASDINPTPVLQVIP